MIAPRGAPLPRDGERRWYKVYSVPQTDALHFICLSPIWDGHWSHWDGVRAYRCTEIEGCEGCRIGHQHRWTGYLAGMELGRRRGEMVAALTPGACLYIDKRVIQHKLDLRGIEMRATRMKRKEDSIAAKNAAVSVELIRRHPLATLAPEFEVLPSVLRMWGIHHQHNARLIREQEAAEQKERRTLPWEHDPIMLAKLSGGLNRE